MTDGATHTHAFLTRCRDDTRAAYFAHTDPGGLTPAQKEAWQLENMGLLLLLHAAQKRLDAEFEILCLLNVERAA
jgi:hypothetical protein